MSGGQDQASHACFANSCRYGSSHHGTRHSTVRDIVTQRDQGMDRLLAETCMDRSTSIHKSGCRRGMATTYI